MTQTPSLAGLSAADRLLHQRIIVLGQQVDDDIANKLGAELLLLSAEDPKRDIALYINSPGGSVSAGLAIYDTMRLIPNDVSTLAMGLAASMGQFLLSAGTPGKRYALPHSRVLMHQGSAGIGGTAIDIETRMTISSALRRIDSAERSIMAIAVVASSWKRRPSSVSSMALLLRTNRRMPSSVSSLRT